MKKLESLPRSDSEYWGEDAEKYISNAKPIPVARKSTKK